MGQILLSIMVSPKRFLLIRTKFWESVGGWALWVDGDAQDTDWVCIICRPMVNVKGSTPLWSICLGLYPRKRSQSGKTTLEHWSMHIIAPKTQPWGSAPTISCLADNLAPSSWCGTWFGSTYHHRAKHNQVYPEIERAYQMGSQKSRGLPRQKRALRHKCNYDQRSRAAALEVGDTSLSPCNCLQRSS